MEERNKWLEKSLPPRLWREILKTAGDDPAFWRRLSEITLRRARVSSLSLDGEQLPLPLVLSEEEIEASFHRLAGGSVYAHKETLSAGFLSLPFGMRAGIAGHAVTENGRLHGVYGIFTISIRLPHRLIGVGEEACRIFRSRDGSGGLLVYSLPGVGKTTLLRDMAEALSKGRDARRVALVDTRGELSPPAENKSCLLDILFGYPKPVGIEIATRTLAPDVIFCDEIGGMEEAEAILKVQNTGVPLIASAHAGSFASLLLRPPIRLLWENGVFFAAYGLRRKADGSREGSVTYYESGETAE